MVALDHRVSALEEYLEATTLPLESQSLGLNRQAQPLPQESKSVIFPLMLILSQILLQSGVPAEIAKSCFDFLKNRSKMVSNQSLMNPSPSTSTTSSVSQLQQHLQQVY